MLSYPLSPSCPFQQHVYIHHYTEENLIKRGSLFQVLMVNNEKINETKKRNSTAHLQQLPKLI